MLVSDPAHRPWAAFVLAATAVAVGAFGWAGRGQARWPDGRSALGLTYGGLAAGLIVFECLLWLRKRYRSVRLFGPAVSWMRAHIWLGLFTVPLVVLHSGLRLGGWLTTGLAVVFAAVILSGVWGWAVQNWLPGRLTATVPEETIHSQADAVMRSHAAEVARLIDDLCGPLPPGAPTAVECAGPDDGGAGSGVVRTAAAVRRSGHVRGTVVTTQSPAGRVAGAEPLRTFFREAACDYLLRGRAGRSPLRQPAEAAGRFAELRGHLPEAARPVADELERQCDRRRQLDRQARLHFWLHNWLWLHLPLSAALLVLTIVHAVSTLRY